MTTRERKLEDDAWKARESDRWWDGTYTQPVWVNEAWWAGRGEPLRYHYPHVSRSNPALIAYTQDAEKGRRDIQTQIKPGRYLSKFFGDVLTEAQIKFYAEWQATGQRPKSEHHDPKKWTLALATEPEDIARVYVDCRAQSCMDGRYFRQDGHPTRVYGAGDLAIAYLHSTGGGIIARALVWPDRKVLGRAYPSPDFWSQDGYTSRTESEAVRDALKERLMAEGYRPTSGGFDGARLLREETDDAFVCPYLDGGYGVDDDGDFLIMRSDGGEYEADNTSGETSRRSRPEAHCERCDEPIYAGDGANTVRVGGRVSSVEAWCDHCVGSAAFYCYGLDETCSDDMLMSEVGGMIYSELWLQANANYSDFSDEWFFGEAVTMENGETWSAEEFAENGFTCAILGVNLPNEDRHPEHPEVSRHVTDSALAEWLDPPTIADERQLELEGA